MNTFEPVKVESCKSCGSSVKQYNPDSLTIICSHCGTHTSNSEQTSYRAPDNRLFKLYDTFEYNSHTWQVIGCICYAGNVREWDDEDNTWETNYWSYASWWVINEARELSWMTQDASGYKWSRKITLASSIPEHDRSYEKGTWKIDSAVGEFSYFPKVGGQSTTYEKNNTSIEIQYDDQGNKKEIESFMSVPMDLVDLLKIFNKTDVLVGLNRIKHAKKAILASLVCLLIGYFVLSGRSESLLSVNSIPIQSSQKNVDIPLGEISLESSSLVQFKFYSNIPRGDGSFEADLIIKDESNNVVSELAISLWRESGYDDGNWTETATTVSPRLNLPENKKYQLSLKPNTFKSWREIKVSAVIQKNVASLFPLIIGAILLILLLIYQSISQRKFIRRNTGLGN